MTSICLIVQSVYDHDPRVRRKAEALAAAGYSVDVLALRPADGQKQYALNDVSIRTLSLRKMRGSLTRYCYEYAAFFLWAFWRVTVQMRRRRYAIVDVNTLPDFLIFAPCLARLMGAKLVLDMHEMTPEFYMSKYGIGEQSPIIRFLHYLERISIAFADHVITISDPVTELFVGRGLDRAKSTVVMNAADDARFRGAAAGQTGDTPASGPRFVMMYHGTLTRLYGLDIAVEAFALARSEMPGAELWILGSGPEAGSLETLAQQRGLGSVVKLIGQVPAGDIPGWLQRSDVGILPIRRDVFLDLCFPNKLPEYITAGKAVLISRLRAIRHYFSEDALGYFEPNDPEALARQMVRLYQDSGVRKRLASNASEQYAPIRWDVMKRRYLDVVGDLISGRVPRAAASFEHAEPAAGSSGHQAPAPTAVDTLPGYVLITAARNEAQFIERTIESVVAQTFRPLKWVIVSDGSTDATDAIVEKHAAQHQWIELVTLSHRTPRSFAGKVGAFNAGYARVANVNYAVIGNLDADVSFDRSYLAFLLNKFAENPRLGVTGTPYQEEDSAHDDRFKSPDHVSGACQLFRRECFEDIGGYLPVTSGGIDLIALLSAQAKGWQTRRFDDKVCQHHRNVGSGQHAGVYRRLFNRGQKDYLLGSHPGFELFRTTFLMKSKPYVVGGLLTMIGYVWAMVRRVERTMPEDLVAIRQSDQLRRLKAVLRHPLRRSRPATEATV